MIIKPGPDVVASWTMEFKEELDSLIQESPEELVIDLTDVEIIDSTGIGVIIAAHNLLDKQGGKLKIINTTNDLYGLFRLMRLNNYIEIDCKK